MNVNTPNGWLRNQLNIATSYAEVSLSCANSTNLNVVELFYLDPQNLGHGGLKYVATSLPQKIDAGGVICNNTTPDTPQFFGLPKTLIDGVDCQINWLITDTDCNNTKWLNWSALIPANTANSLLIDYGKDPAVIETTGSDITVTTSGTSTIIRSTAGGIFVVQLQVSCSWD